MPSVSTHFEVIRQFQQKIATADSYELVYDAVVSFFDGQMGVAAVGLGKTAVSLPPSSPTYLHLNVPNTPYSLKLTHSGSFSEEDQELAELVSALLASAPFFKQQGDASRSRFLEAVYTVGETIRELDSTEEILEAVQRQLLDLFSMSTGFIGLFDAEKQEFRLDD